MEATPYYEGRVNYCVQAMLSHYIPTQKDFEEDDSVDGKDDDGEENDEKNEE